MRLTQRQRPAGLLPASLPFFGLCWLLSSALAAELPLDPNSHIGVENVITHEQANELRPEYEPEFGAFDRSIIGRQEGGASNPIKKDTPTYFNIEPGTSRCYALSREDLLAGDDDDDSNSRNELRDLDGSSDEAEHTRRKMRRQTPASLMVSATTCLQPSLDNDDDPKQLRLLVAKPGATQCPEWKPERERPGEDDPNYFEEYEFEEGLVFESFEPPDDGPTYVSIYAPESPGDFQGVYNFELVMSTRAWYHRYVASKELLWMDSDSSAALLRTNSLSGSTDDTDKVLKRDPPFELYVEDRDKPVFNGIRRSLCGIEKKALISANKDGNGRQHDLVRTSMTTRGDGDFAKQQFYLEGLKSSSKYSGVLVQVADAGEYDNFFPSNGKRQEGGGGRQMSIFEPTNFETLTGTTCKVITDLDFCTETQHAVPGNNDLEGPQLAQIYDDYAREMYSHFEKIMMQIPCETDPTSKYSLTRSCDDCKDAYKRWLCAVVIPRCEDWTSNNAFAIPRNVGQPFPNGTFVDELEENKYRVNSMTTVPGWNASRNAFIDEKIAPGPYKEVLPCHELCYEVVQNCPASLGFGCPLKGMTAFEYSYGTSEVADVVTCQYPGQPRTRFAAASSMYPSMTILLSLASFGIFMAA